MKKNHVKLPAMLLALTMALVMAGCGGKDDIISGSTPSEAGTESKAEISTEANTETGTVGTEIETEADIETSEPGEKEGYTTLAEWYTDNLAEFKEVEDALNENAEGMTIYLLVEGDVLIYRYVFDEALDVSDEAVKEQVTVTFDTNFDEMEDNFYELAAKCELEAGLEEGSVRVMVEVMNPGDELIYVRDFAD